MTNRKWIRLITIIGIGFPNRIESGEKSYKSCVSEVMGLARRTVGAVLPMTLRWFDAIANLNDGLFFLLVIDGTEQAVEKRQYLAIRVVPALFGQLQGTADFDHTIRRA